MQKQKDIRGKVKDKSYLEWNNRFQEIDLFLMKVNQKRQEGVELPREILERAVALKQERKQVERILRCWTSALEFGYEYFSDDFNPENENNLIPSGIAPETAPDFHKELTDYLDNYLYEPTNRLAWSVPRSHAKSTWLSNIYPIFNIVYNLRSFIVIISETEAGSRQFTEYVNNQLKHNKKLRDDFGILMSTNIRENEKDNNEQFVTLNNIKVLSASTQKQLRGARHLNERPDLIICDDLESSKNTNTPELRLKNLHWFNSVVVPLGSPDKTGFIYMGTLVHPSGLLPAVMARADFKSKRYSAIVSPPVNQELWDEYERIYSDAENPNRKEDAEKYYFENQERMDEGVKTLWAGRFPYYKLLQEKHNVGTRAFNSEYLNIPYSDEDAIFKPSMFTFFDEKDLYDQFNRHIPLELYGFWDIAITGKGDYNCIVTLGRDRRTGIFYVLDCWLKKCNMHEALEVAAQKIMQFEHHTFGVETVQAQWSAFKQLQQLLVAKGYYKTRLKPIQPRSKKEQRIEMLEPLVEQGALRFKRTQRLAVEMFEQFPNHDHDDAPDAIASCVDLAGNKRKRIFREKPTGW
ncbi:phage terminase large subunit [Bacillus cereus]|uniref:phage terminase large subunit n=1 Tax=Bacillus cereus TaxID=1396 RepID=UPI0035567E0E